MQLEYLETYRRGRNETDSKSVCPKGHEGSNPSVSVLATMDLPFGKSFRFVKDGLDKRDWARIGKCGRVCASRDKENGWEWGKGRKGHL